MPINHQFVSGQSDTSEPDVVQPSHWNQSHTLPTAAEIGASATGHTHNASDLTAGTLPDARFPAVLPAVSGANLTNLPAGGSYDPRTSATTFCDFFTISGGIVVGGPYTISNTGTAAATAIQLPASSNRPGIARMTTGSTATGRTTYITDAVTGTVMFFGGGAVTWESSINITTLSAAAQRFSFRAGFIDALSGDPVDGAFIEYDEATSPNWKCVTANNSVRTRNTSTTAVTAAAWHDLKITVNAAGTSVSFFVDGVELTGGSASPITTNIPTTSARAFGYGARLEKIVGTTARTVDIDWERFELVFTTPR